MVTVVCTGGEAPPSALCLSWLDAAGQIIAADGGLRILRAAGRRANLWIGDGDSLGSPLEDWSPWFDRSRPLPPEKDESDTEAAVLAALESGAEEVWLLGGGGGRLDHWWSNLQLFASQPRLTRWVTAWEQAWTLDGGAAMTLGPGTVSVLPLGRGPWKAESEGLAWPLSKVDFSRWYSLSNQASEGGAKVRALEGRFLVSCPFPGRSLP